MEQVIFEAEHNAEQLAGGSGLMHESAWMEEVQRRAAMLERGEMGFVDEDVLFARYADLLA